MPKALEQKLKREAKKKGLSGKRAGAYVYGTLRKTGWTPSKPKRGKKRKPKATSRKRSRVRKKRK